MSTFASLERPLTAAQDDLAHPVLSRAFTPEMREEMRADDGRAWTAVSGILFFIVTLGTILGLIGVLCAL
jgi:hypothetical protein